MTAAVPARDAPLPIPGRIGGVLKILASLIAHARYFTATAAARAAAPEFVIVAAIFGTHELPVIVTRVQRGILRALALQRYLLARAARGRDLRFIWPPRLELLPHHRPPSPPPPPVPSPPPPALRQAHAARTRPAPDPAALCPGDPAASRLPSTEEFDAWARRRPVGRSMAYICMDLGIVPGLCDGAFWNKVDKILRRYGGSLGQVCQLREKRAVCFQRERDRRPETWDTDWRDLRKPTVRRVLGCLIGEVPPHPDPLIPAIVPS